MLRRQEEELDAAGVARVRQRSLERAAGRAKEAADTLEAIRQARASDVKTPAPSPTKSQPRADGSGASPTAPAAATDHAALEREQPSVVRKRHDEAMQVLQKH